MAKQKSGGSVGGFVFNVFNVGFTVFMFILPTIGLAYWYLYIRDGGGGQVEQPKTVVQQVPETKAPTAVDQPTDKPDEPAPMKSRIFDELSEGGTSPTVPGNDAAPPPDTPVRGQYEVRAWTDQSGKFSVEAKFYSATNDVVKLVGANDRRLEVPIEKLCDADKEYLRAVFKEKGITARF